LEWSFGLVATTDVLHNHRAVPVLAATVMSRQPAIGIRTIVAMRARPAAIVGAIVAR
jgi:hypothetical protein